MGWTSDQPRAWQVSSRRGVYGVGRRPSLKPPMRMHLWGGDGIGGFRLGGDDSKATRFLLYWKSAPWDVPYGDSGGTTGVGEFGFSDDDIDEDVANASAVVVVTMFLFYVYYILCVVCYSPINMGTVVVPCRTVQ